MKINKNIWNKILDKVVLNKWKNQVKNINREYFNKFRTNYAGMIFGEFLDNFFHNCSGYSELNAPLYNYHNHKYIRKIIYHKCHNCNKSYFKSFLITDEKNLWMKKIE